MVRKTDNETNTENWGGSPGPVIRADPSSKDLPKTSVWTGFLSGNAKVENEGRQFQNIIERLGKVYNKFLSEENTIAISNMQLNYGNMATSLKTNRV